MESKNEMDILLDWLSPDRDAAELLYLELRRRLVYMFRFSNEPEDLASETLDRALKNIRNGKVTDFSGNPFHYIFRIARYVKLEKFRERKTLQLDEGAKEPMAESQNKNFPEELYQIIEKCLDELPAKDKELFLDYLFPPKDISGKDHHQKVSEKWNININPLRVRIFRIKGVLRNCADRKLNAGQ